MRKAILSIMMLVLSSLCMAQVEDRFTEVNEFGGEEVKPNDCVDFLGFMLLSGSNTLVRFYEIHENEDHTLKYTQLTMDGFVYRAMGQERSKANPYGKNLFESYGIKDPNIVSALWKLRYKEYPYAVKRKTISNKPESEKTPEEKEAERLANLPERGWGNNDKYPEMPSPAQFMMLSKYGIKRLQDLCYGDMAFLLLKDMCDINWVSKYMNTGCGGAVPETNVPGYDDDLPPIDR